MMALIKTLQSEKDMLNSRLLLANTAMMNQAQAKSDEEESPELAQENYIHMRDTGLLWSSSDLSSKLKTLQK